MKRSRSGSPLRASAIMIVALLAASCSSTGANTGGGNPNLITQEQIELLPDGTAFSIIQRFRSGWLRARTQATLSSAEPEYAVVYLDDMRYGEIDTLGGISANQIQTIQFISAQDATTRYGTGYMGGIIRINTR